MVAASSIDWTNVLVALIAGLPAIIAAIGVLLLHRQIKTPSGTAIGEQIEGILHTALANNYHLRSIGDAVSATASPEATVQAKQVPDLPEGSSDPPLGR